MIETGMSGERGSGLAVYEESDFGELWKGRMQCSNHGIQRQLFDFNPGRMVIGERTVQVDGDFLALIGMRSVRQKKNIIHGLPALERVRGIRKRILDQQIFEECSRP